LSTSEPDNTNPHVRNLKLSLTLSVGSWLRHLQNTGTETKAAIVMVAKTEKVGNEVRKLKVLTNSLTGRRVGRWSVHGTVPSQCVVVYLKISAED